MFGSMAKWTAEILDPDRASEILMRAIQVATQGLPGPVVIAIPEDVLDGANDGASCLAASRDRSGSRAS